jgi:hypothetical protein
LCPAESKGGKYDAAPGVWASRRRVDGGRAWGGAGGAMHGTRLRLGARAERTSNMRFMSVTLDVSKLSGWLSADACCRFKRRACDEVRAGRREVAERRRSASGVHGKGPTQGMGARARAGRTRNMLFMFVTVDVSKLSVWLNADATCRVEGRAYDAGRGADREVGGCEAAAAQVACTRKARLKAGGQGTRGAHVEHVFHGCGLGRVKAQRLVEFIRVLPSRREGVR